MKKKHFYFTPGRLTKTIILCESFFSAFSVAPAASVAFVAVVAFVAFAASVAFVAVVAFVDVLSPSCSCACFRLGVFFSFGFSSALSPLIFFFFAPPPCEPCLLLSFFPLLLFLFRRFG